MVDDLFESVRRRAAFRCEYCRLPAGQLYLRFEIEHVIPRKHGGLTRTDNLTFACLHCNRHKGPNVAGVDRRGLRRKVVPLFNPRRQKWDSHFRLEGSKLIGLSAIGRVTVDVLAMNDSYMLELRENILNEGYDLPDE